MSKVLELLRSRSKERAETDPQLISAMLAMMKHRLERIQKIEANSEELLELIDPDDHDDPDYSKEHIISSGKRSRIKMQEARFETGTRECKGVKVIIRKLEGSSGSAVAYDGGSGRGFELTDGESVTGEIDYLSLALNGSIDLQNTVPSRWRESEYEQSPQSPFTISNIYALDSAGVLRPTIDIELA